MQKLNLIKHSEKSTIEIVKNGLSKDGAVCITHHKIPKELIKSSFEEFDKLISMPEAVKDRISGPDSGYSRLENNELFTISAKYDPSNTKDLYNKKNRTKELAFSSSKKLFEELYLLSYGLLIISAKALGDYSDTFIANKMYGGESKLILSSNPLVIEKPSNLISLHIDRRSGSLLACCGNELMKHSHDYFEDMGKEMGHINFFASGRK